MISCHLLSIDSVIGIHTAPTSDSFASRPIGSQVDPRCLAGCLALPRDPSIMPPSPPPPPQPFHYHHHRPPRLRARRSCTQRLPGYREPVIIAMTVPTLDNQQPAAITARPVPRPLPGAASSIYFVTVAAGTSLGCLLNCQPSTVPVSLPACGSSAPQRLASSPACRWQRLLHRDGAAMPGLWERYLQLERGSCSDFRLAKLTDAYVEAIGAIGGQVARFRREEAPHGELLKVGLDLRAPPRPTPLAGPPLPRALCSCTPHPPTHPPTTHTHTHTPTQHTPPPPRYYFSLPGGSRSLHAPLQKTAPSRPACPNPAHLPPAPHVLAA